MSRLSGVYDEFQDLDKIPLEEINTYLPFPIEPHILGNFIANRVIYPQSIPMNSQEMEIDLAVLRALIKRSPKSFFNESKSSIVLPKDFILRFSPPGKLLALLSEELPLKEVTKVFIKENWSGTRLTGSIICPQNLKVGSVVFLNLGGRNYKLKPQTFAGFPNPSHKISLSINNQNILGASGGDLGLFIDLRRAVPIS